jgi:hypothetical protein
VSTRKLIVVALLCGLAILVAGGIQLFRILTVDEATLPNVGEQITVGGIEATVTSADVGPERIRLVVTMTSPSTGPELDDVSAAWSISTGDDRNAQVDFIEPPSPGPCRAAILVPGQSLSCSLAFERRRGTPYARFSAGNMTGVWVLPS